jgi:two-component system, cell cycle sensor histidine kinase and response regulator CckA
MRFLASAFFIIATIIWASAFGFLSIHIHDILQAISLLVIGVISLLILTYWARLIHSRHQLHEKLNFFQSGISCLAPTIEAVMIDNAGHVGWTTHPNTYPNLQEFQRRVMARISDPHIASQIQDLMANRQRGEILFHGGGNGLGQDQKWWIFTLAPFDKNSMVLIVRDVSHHFDNYNQLRQSYTLLENFIDNAPFGLFYSSRQGHILGLNSTLANWLDLSKDHVISRPINDFIKETESTKGTVKIQTKAGSGYKALMYVPEEDPQTKTRPTILCRLDQLPSNQNLGELIQDVAYLDASIAAVMIDPEGTILSYNPAFSLLLGELPIKNKFIDLVHPANRKDVANKIKRAFESRSGVAPFEVRFDGDRTHTTSYASKARQKSQRQELMLQFIDISEQKRLEGQFIQSQKMQAVGQLAGGIAHDFNNLLTAMIGYCDLLLQRYLPNDPSYNDVVQVKQNANRAANLVRQLLAFSRQQTLQPKVVNITDNLVEVSTLLRRLIGAGIELNMVHGRDLWPVKVDVSQLEQVIINLVVNARDAMHQGGTLTIQTENLHFAHQQRIGHDLVPKGDYVSIDVIDTGCGIAPEHLEFIFEPFFSTKEVGQGTGLGLSTVYGIVKQTGGFVLVESKAGKGTTFKILLPRFSGAVEQENEKIETIHADLTGGGTILLVEDEDAVRMFSARALREKGYRVLEAPSGEAALELINRGEKFDILVTDVVMPKMDGPTLSKKIRDLHPEAKTIFISGYTEDTFRKNLDYDAKIHFLPKPFTLKDLASKVKEVLTVNRDNTSLTV